MAHGITQVHQALHGYVDGHRLLSASTSLSPRDQKTMLALSDISGTGATLAAHGYLTGYPLIESGFYALARTWPALEKSRPGCVWTHTVLIEFNDLATIELLSNLNCLFNRPEDPDNFKAYSSALVFTASPPSELSSKEIEWAKPVVAALYKKPEYNIVAEGTGPEVDNAVLGIWSQQWPRLRRNFRFCTLSINNRSTESVPFDLQTTVSDHFFRMKSPHVLMANSVNWDDGSLINEILEDLIKPDRLGLRTFLRRLGPDISPGGREIFLSLCEFHRVIRVTSEKELGASKVVSFLECNSVLRNSKTAKAIAARIALDHIDTIDDSSFEFIWENISLIKPTAVSSNGAKLGKLAWEKSSHHLIKALSSDGAERDILRQAIQALKLTNLIDGLIKQPELLGFSVQVRPEILKEPNFWRNAASWNIEQVEAILRLANTVNLQQQTIEAIILSRRAEPNILMAAKEYRDLLACVFKAFNTESVLRALSQRSVIHNEDLKPWLETATRDTAGIATFLESGSMISKKFIYELTKTTTPDSLPKSQNLDAWLTAWQNSIDEITISQKIYIHSFFLCRALGKNTNAIGELIGISFDQVHQAIAKNQISNECWYLLEPRLPSSILWFSWDRCQRLRTGVVTIFIDKHLSENLFLSLTQSDDLFRQLVECAAESSKGRKYLRAIILDDNQDNFLNNRISIIRYRLS